MNLPTIRVSPSNLPKFSFLQYRNYLGEFKTEIDKARVRYNLGIPDSLSFKWGNIGGTIENQQDLILLIRQSIINQYNPLSSTVEGLVNKTNTIGDSILTLLNEKNNIQIFNNNYKQELEQRLLEIEREVSLNAALIKLIGGDGTTVDLSAINSAINSLRDRVSALENSLPSQSTNYDSRLSSIEGQINSLQLIINQILSLIGVQTLQSITLSRNNIQATTSSDKASIIVTATFSNGNTRDVTSECSVESSNVNIVTWNNGILFNGPGNATVTFTYTYNGTTLSEIVNVSVSGTDTAYFLAYAPISALLNGQVLGNTDCILRSSSSTIERTGENIYKYQGVDLGDGQLSEGAKLFFCCPSNKTFSEWNENYNNTGYESLSYNTYTMDLGNETYKIYYISPSEYGGFIYQFKIT